MRLLDQVFLTHLQTVFGSTATIEDVKVTDGVIEFSLPINQVQQFPHGVSVEMIGIYDGKLDCSMTENELTVQLHFAHAMMAAAKDPIIRFDTQVDPAPPAFGDTRLPQLIAEESVRRQIKQERDNWNERQQAKNNREV